MKQELRLPSPPRSATRAADVARAAFMGSKAASCSAVSGGAEAEVDETVWVDGRRGWVARSRVARPRDSRRRRSWVPSWEAGRGWTARVSRAARWPAVRRVPSSRAEMPAGVIEATSTRFSRRPCAAPAGSSTCSARAGVEQYSAAIQIASLTRSGGSRAGSSSWAVASRSAGISELGAVSAITARIARPANGTRNSEPTPAPSNSAGSL